MKLLKKITLKDLNNLKPNELKAKVEAAEGQVFVGRIVGSVRSQFVKPTPFGESLGFKGSFVGYGIDGEESRAAVAYLPSPLDEMLSEQINELQGDKDRLESPVDFAVDVFAIADGCQAGYKYIPKPLLDTVVSDPMANLLKSVAPLALAAPTETVSAQNNVALTETAQETETPKKGAKGK